MKIIRLGTLLCIPIAVWAQQTPSTPQSAAQYLQAERYEWTTEKWTGDNPAYAAIRRLVDKDLFSNPKSLNLVRQYQNMAKAQPQDAKEQFRWIYASYRAALNKTAGAEAHLAQASQVFRTIPSPRVYEWTRLRFLVEARAFPEPHLRLVSERLLQHNQNDFEVKYRAIAVLNPGKSVVGKRQALAYAHDLIRMNPERASGFSALAGIYYRSWLLSKDPTDSRQAITAYQRYLRLASPKEPFRQQVPHLISLMQKRRN